MQIESLPSRQEMFNRAWEGLKAQRWVKSYSFTEGACVYAKRDEFGNVIRRCAWGHVDPEGTSFTGLASVRALADCGVGLAPRLPFQDLLFAQELQNTHDESKDGDDMQERMRALASDYALVVPE